MFPIYGIIVWATVVQGWGIVDELRWDLDQKKKNPLFCQHMWFNTNFTFGLKIASNKRTVGQEGLL